MLLILAGPLIFRLSQVLVGAGILAVVSYVWFRRPLGVRSLMILALSTVVVFIFSLMMGVVSNTVYNTAFLGGINYELTPEERAYADEAWEAQSELSSILSDQDFILEEHLDYSYPYGSWDDSVDSQILWGSSNAIEDTVKTMQVPLGCEEHHELLSETAEAAGGFTLFSASGMTPYSEFGVPLDQESVDENFSYAESAQSRGNQNYYEAVDLLKKINRRGCAEPNFLGF